MAPPALRQGVHRMRPRTLLLVAAAVAVALPGTALASTPGHNGLISFRRYFNADHFERRAVHGQPRRHARAPDHVPGCRHARQQPELVAGRVEAGVRARHAGHRPAVHGRCRRVRTCTSSSRARATTRAWGPATRHGRRTAIGPFQLALGPVVNGWAADVSNLEGPPGRHRPAPGDPRQPRRLRGQRPELVAGRDAAGHPAQHRHRPVPPDDLGRRLDRRRPPGAGLARRRQRVRPPRLVAGRPVDRVPYRQRCARVGEGVPGPP